MKEITTIIIVIAICITAYSISKVYSPYPDEYEVCTECTMGGSTLNDCVTTKEAIDTLEF